MSDPTVNIARDLNAQKVRVIGSKNGNGSDPIVAYINEFKGKSYFHIRMVWQNDRGIWCAGKGIAIDPANAKAVLTALGAAASSY